MAEAPPGARILGLALSFLPCKVLCQAAKYDVFTYLHCEGPKTAAEIAKHFRWHCTPESRAAWDFLDALVVLRFLDRDTDDKHSAKYSNTEESKTFLVKSSPSYIGGILIMVNDRLFKFASDLGEGLETGKPVNETKTNPDANLFEVAKQNPALLDQFARAMTGVTLLRSRAFVKVFDFQKYKSFVDIGGSLGTLAMTVAAANPHLKCSTFDLPELQPLAEKFIAENKMQDRVSVLSGDFFKDALPQADVITMSNILHDWSLEKKKILMKKALEALHPQGVFVSLDSYLDDTRRQPGSIAGLCMSLNMLVELGDGVGFDYSHAEFAQWAKEVGFSRTECIPQPDFNVHIAFK